MFIVSRWNQISQKLGEALVVQKYIHKPMLINGNKFDLRLYALVTCWDPLKVYVYKQGTFSFSSSSYYSQACSGMNESVRASTLFTYICTHIHADINTCTLMCVFSYVCMEEKNARHTAYVYNSAIDFFVRNGPVRNDALLRVC